MVTMVSLLCLVLLALPSPSITDWAPNESSRERGSTATRRNTVTSSTPIMNNFDMALRLANRSRCVGRVEIYHNGEWGTVCDDLWDLKCAEVVCRQIGCGKAISFHANAFFGPGNGSIVLDDVICQGNETNLSNCSHRGLAKHNCGHAEDVGVTCNDPYPVTSTAPGPQPIVTTTSGPQAVITTTSGSPVSSLMPQNTTTQHITTTPPVAGFTPTRINTSDPYPVSSTASEQQYISSTVPDKSSTMSTEMSTSSGSPVSSPGPLYTTQGTTPAAPGSPVSSLGPLNTTQGTTPAGPERNNTCGEILTNSYGRITSPYYPNSYPANSHCTWEIWSEPNTVIELIFRKIDLENHPTCQYDSVSIYDGPPGRSLVGKLCQSEKSTFYSSSSVMSLVFITDGAVQYTGFDAYYNTSTAANGTSERNDKYTCKEILTERYGRIISPLYPSSYPRNTNCTWEIRSAPNTLIELNFVKIDLESYNNCTYDSVTIYDGPFGSYQLGRVCQSRDETFNSSSNVMTLAFITDGSIQTSGFEAYYKTSTAQSLMSEKCGDIMTDLQGVFQSPRTTSLDSGYCVWHINVKNNYKIHLHFSNFQIKTSDSCGSCSLLVYDGTPQRSPLLGKLCETTARHFTSSYNSISIVYTKVRSDTDTCLEFSATYYTVFQSNSNVTLSCHSDYMEARVSSPYLESLGYNLNNIFLNDPHCRPQVIDGWLEFHIPYQNCQTLKQVLNDTINYVNTLFTYHVEPVVIYRKKLSVTLRCEMYQETIVDSLYFADDTSENSLTQYGLYTANLTFFISPSFINPVYQYPYYVELNQNLYLQATLDTTDPALVLFVDTCVASPDPFNMSRNVYHLIHNGCPQVSDYQKYPSPLPSTVRLGFSAFSFMRRFSSVYIQCKLVVCKQYVRWSRCSQGCKPRNKRAVESHPDHVYAVAGPIKLLK